MLTLPQSLLSYWQLCNAMKGHRQGTQAGQRQMGRGRSGRSGNCV